MGQMFFLSSPILQYAGTEGKARQGPVLTSGLLGRQTADTSVKTTSSRLPLLNTMLLVAAPPQAVTTP